MKRTLVCTLAAAMVLLTGKIGFSEEKAKAAEPNVIKRVAPAPTQPGKPGITQEQLDMIKKKQQERMAERQDKHDAYIKKIQDIKALALEEKATKTAAALDKFIAEQEEEFKKAGGQRGMQQLPPLTPDRGKPAGTEKGKTEPAKK
jgi:hypothetical protein